MLDLPEPLPSLRPLTDRDRDLRLTIGELVVHTRCGRIRGPIGRLPARCDCTVNLGVWQSCPCEDEPVRWRADMSSKYDLCIVCARGIAGGTSRWSWLGCACCREVNKLLRSQAPLALPLGRHSIMNGAGIPLAANGVELDGHIANLIATVDRMGQLADWYDAEFTRLRIEQGWTEDANVLLRTWQERLPASREASLDAFTRLLRVDVRRLLTGASDGQILSPPDGILGFEGGE